MFSAPPVQTRLPLALAKVEHPLISIDAAMVQLDLRLDDVVHLVECGKLQWSFDLARRDKRKREVRILDRCIREFKAGLIPSAASPGSHNISKAQQEEQALLAVIDEILPPLRGPLGSLSSCRCSELKERFSCDGSHMIHLVKDGEFQIVGTGTRRSPLISRQSAVEFLKRRKL